MKILGLNSKININNEAGVITKITRESVLVRGSDWVKVLFLSEIEDGLSNESLTVLHV